VAFDIDPPAEAAAERPAPASDDLLTIAPPRLDEAHAEALAREAFGIAARARRLTSERDLNFALACDDGAGFVLKIANAGESQATLDFQLGALEHVAAADPAIPVPRVRRPLDGERLARVDDETGRPHLVTLLGFLPGAPLAAAAPTTALVAEVGALLARLDVALAGYEHPAAERALLWDLGRAGDLAGLVDHVEDERLRDRVAAVLDDFAARAVPVLPMLRRQVIHNDPNPHNLVVAPPGDGPGEAARVAGIIDFGDMLRAPLVNDLAVAASYHVARGEAPLGMAAGLIAAYHRTNPLTAAETGLLPLMIATRCVLTVVITAWRAALYPENRDYILRNVPAATAALERLSGAAGDRAAAAIHAIGERKASER